MRSGERSKAAFHESGHAVVALALGAGVRNVTIANDGTGLCKVLTPPHWRSSADGIRKSMWITLAGRAADGELWTALPDWQSAHELAERLARLAGGRAADHVGREFASVHQYVSTQLPWQVLALSRVLEQRGQLDGVDVESIVGRRGPRL